MKTTFDLNSIRIFAAVADAGSMSSAAKTLDLPVSTISRSIAGLERSLGLLLIRRGQAGTSLTDAGAEYLPSCLEALEFLETGHQHLTRQEPQPTGVIRIGCPVTMARYVLAPVMKTFTNRFPHLAVNIIPHTPNGLISTPEDVDILFHVLPLKGVAGTTRRFPSARRGLFASSNYALAAGLPLTPEDLVNYKCIGFQGTAESSRWKLACGTRTIDVEVPFHVMAPDPVITLRLLTEDFGIAILPIWIAGDLHTEGALVRVLPEWEPETIPLFATYAGNGSSIAKANIFLTFIREYLGTEIDPRMSTQPSAACFS